MKTCSTREAAKRLGISFTALNRYIAAGKIPVPSVTQVGGVTVRLWTDRDIERVRKQLPKIADGRRKKKKKAKK